MYNKISGKGNSMVLFIYHFTSIDKSTARIYTKYLNMPFPRETVSHMQIHKEYSTTDSTGIIHMFHKALLYPQQAASRN